MKTVGIIGCGAIGSIISRAIERGLVTCDKLVLYDTNLLKAERLRDSLIFSAEVVASLQEMLSLKPTVIVEAASQQAVIDYIDRILEEDIELVVMSVGALLSIKTPKMRVHVPSGAIGGLDSISSAALAGIDEVLLTTRKSPGILSCHNPQEEIVFEGSVHEAVSRFPKEMNVAATLSMSVSPEKIRVRVISDPDASRNVHEIVLKWKFGNMHLRFANDPHPDNPKTSALAAWSAIRVIREILKADSSPGSLAKPVDS